MDITTGDELVYPFSQQSDSPSRADKKRNIDRLQHNRSEALRELKSELSNMPHKEVSQYVHVQRNHPELVSNNSLEDFLRAEDFDVKLAAKRVAKYWEARQKIFGHDKFALHMTLNGAMKDSEKALKVGWLNLLPYCDEKGRGIIYAESILVNSENFDSREQLRVFWYLMHVAMERPGVKESGIVIVANAEDTTLAHFDTHSATGICQTGDRLLPIRLVKFHLLHANPIFPLVAVAVRSFLTPRQRNSFVLHNGTAEMVLTSLGKFGIPRDRLPKRIGGELDITAIGFLNSRITIEGGNHPMSFGGQSSLMVSSHDESSDSSSRGDEMCVGDDFSIKVDNDDFEFEPFEEELAAEAFQGISSHEQNLVENQAVTSMDGYAEQVTNDDYSEPQPKGVPSSNPALSDVEEEASSRSFVKIKCAKKKCSKTEVGKKKSFVKKSGRGRSGDPRMNRAVSAKLQNPQLPLVTALLEGGFVFPSLDEPCVKVSAVLDTDGVTIYQRRNQLLRRLRLEKGKAKDT